MSSSSGSENEIEIFTDPERGGLRYVSAPESKNKMRHRCKALIWGLVMMHAPAGGDETAVEFMRNRTDRILLRDLSVGNVMYPWDTKQDRVCIYFAHYRKRKRIYFLGCISSRNPTLSLLRDLRAYNDWKRQLYLFPCQWLSDESSLARAIWERDDGRIHVSWDWKSDPCFLCLVPYPEHGICKRFPEDELYQRIRLRCRVYKRGCDSATTRYMREQMESACPLGSERDAAMDWVARCLLAMAFSRSLPDFFCYEMEFMRLHIQYQLDTPGKRKHVLEFNGLVEAYGCDVAKQDENREEDYYSTWIMGRYHTFLEDLCASVSNLGPEIPDALQKQIVAVANIITSEM
jgi:hypothetical protein